MNEWLKNNSKDLIICSLLFLISIIVKSFYIGKTNIGGDECFSVYIAQLPVLKIIPYLSTGDNPPLWEIILSEISIRTPALLFNSLTIIPIYFIGKIIHSKTVGITAVLLFTFSSFSIFLAHEARVYSLVTLLSALSMLTFVKIIQNPKGIKLYILLTLINSLILYSHYIAGWIIAVQFIFFILNKNFRKTSGFYYLIHLVGVVILFSPFIPVIINRFLDSGMKGTWIPKVKNITSLYNMLWIFSNKPVPASIFILFLIAATVYFFHSSIKAKKMTINSQVLLVSMWCFLPLILSFLISFKVSFFLDRYFFFTTPAYYTLISLSIYFLFKNNRFLRLPVVFITVLLMVFSVKFDSGEVRYSGYHTNTELFTEYIKSTKTENTAVILNPKFISQPFTYYFDKTIFTTYFEEIHETIWFKTPLNQQDIFPVNNLSELHLTKKYTRIIFLEDNNCKADCDDSELMTFLKTNHKIVSQKEFDKRKVIIFEPSN